VRRAQAIQFRVFDESRLFNPPLLQFTAERMSCNLVWQNWRNFVYLVRWRRFLLS